MTLWLEAQNSDSAVMAHAASDTLWCRVQRMRVAQIVLIVALPILAAIVAELNASFQIFSAYFGFVMMITDVFINDAISRTRQDAAQLQDRFDSIALSLPRARLRVLDDPDIARISDLSALQPHTRSFRNFDWYTTSLGALPLAFGRIACMRESIHWDSNTRRVWAAIMLCAPIVSLAALVTWALLVHKPVDDFFIGVLAPLAPAIVWALREWREQSNSAAIYESLREKLRVVWDSALDQDAPEHDLESAATTFASSLLAYRGATSPVPDALYGLLRDTRSGSASSAAQLLLQQYDRRLARP